MKQTEIDELVTAWQVYCKALGNWKTLTENIEPKATGCGPVYEIVSPLNRSGEGFAIADMRNIDFAEPHYHPKGNWEFYIVLQGAATVVVGDKEQEVSEGNAVIIPPDTAHFTIPNNDFVIVAINTPPFRPENYIKLTRSSPAVGYDHEQFKRLTNA